MPVSGPYAIEAGQNFEQNIAYDTSRIRNELGYREPIPESEGLHRTLAADSEVKN